MGNQIKSTSPELRLLSSWHISDSFQGDHPQVRCPGKRIRLPGSHEALWRSTIRINDPTHVTTEPSAVPTPRCELSMLVQTSEQRKAAENRAIDALRGVSVSVNVRSYRLLLVVL